MTGLAVVSSATTTPAASVPPAASATAMAAPPAAPTATFPRTRLVDDQRAPEKILAVERSDGLFGVRIILKFGETEPPRLAAEPVFQQRQLIRSSAYFGE